jgi:predicted AlkP superfamily phosphohydrolase/phosphomutase
MSGSGFTTSRGWPRTGRPAWRAGPSPVTSAFGPEHHVGLAADRTRHGCEPAVAIVLGFALLLAVPATAEAYIGPGAGFALLSSFLVMLVTVVLAMAAIVAWPARALWRLATGRRRPVASIRRLVVIGLDGQDPEITDRLLAEGRLPNFARLAAGGAYTRLQTTFPSVSPVAWSSFSTGTSPARHNIFDFLDRDRRTYLPVLSSAYVGRVDRFLKLGRFRIPLKRPELRLLRRSKPFWAILGEHRVWSTILRVPITFPPDRFYGAELSAMSAPDLLGTQGTFTVFTTRAATAGFKEGGRRVAVTRSGDRIETTIEGPPNSFVAGDPPMALPLEVRLDGGGPAEVRIDGSLIRLSPGRLSDWVTLPFRAAPGVRVHGICRLLLTETDPEFSLYMTPINIDPDKPAMPISHPSYYASYLAARIGPYATLGLAEDTWALNEGVIDDEAFLQQSYDIDRERQAMFFAALDRLREGVLVTVFDATDRIQHMFWRDTEPGHPAARGRTRPPGPNAIEALYAHNDALVGRALDRLGEDDVLMVISDHGFTSFRRGVNLNRWLLDHGYLHLKPGTDGSSDWLRDVDWPRTRAYALGLTSMFLNLQGREASGIVSPREAQALKQEIIAALSGLKDDAEIAIREVFDTAALYSGPYLGNAPDLLVGYNRGYRVSWDCATGIVSGPLFEDNVKAWSGDHCVDPRLVPGVFFCNRPIDVEDPALIDIAPTALTLFGIDPPAHMEGKPLWRA